IIRPAHSWYSGPSSNLCSVSQSEKTSDSESKLLSKLLLFTVLFSLNSGQSKESTRSAVGLLKRDWVESRSLRMAKTRSFSSWAFEEFIKEGSFRAKSSSPANDCLVSLLQSEPWQL